VPLKCWPFIPNQYLSLPSSLTRSQDFNWYARISLAFAKKKVRKVATVKLKGKIYSDVFTLRLIFSNLKPTLCLQGTTYLLCRWQPLRFPRNSPPLSSQKFPRHVQKRSPKDRHPTQFSTIYNTVVYCSKIYFSVILPYKTKLQRFHFGLPD
jgi:hypothetical protein